MSDESEENYFPNVYSRSAAASQMVVENDKEIQDLSKRAEDEAKSAESAAYLSEKSFLSFLNGSKDALISLAMSSEDADRAFNNIICYAEKASECYKELEKYVRSVPSDEESMHKVANCKVSCTLIQQHANAAKYQSQVAKKFVEESNKLRGLGVLPFNSVSSFAHSGSVADGVVSSHSNSSFVPPSSTGSGNVYNFFNGTVNMYGLSSSNFLKPLPVSNDNPPNDK